MMAWSFLTTTPARERKALDMLKQRTSIFNMKTGRPNYGGIHQSVLRRLHARGRGWAFTPSDFADLGDPRSVGMVLSRLTKQGKIRRVQRGVYDVMHEHPIVGTMGAGSDAIMAAIARRDGLQLLPSGAASANNLGLSTQVPASTSYGVAGRSRVVAVGGKATVRLKRRSPKSMALAGRASGWLAEALRNLGHGKVGSKELQALKEHIPPKARKELIEDIRYVPAWMRPLFLEVAQDA